jgi:hypothetical protein
MAIFRIRVSLVDLGSSGASIVVAPLDTQGENTLDRRGAGTLSATVRAVLLSVR